MGVGRSLAWAMAAAAALAPSIARALVEPATGTRFDNAAEVDGAEFDCLGAGVRAVGGTKTYAIAFCLELGFAETLVAAYLQQAHPDARGHALAKALQADLDFFELLAKVPAEKVVVLKMARTISREELADSLAVPLSGVLSKEKLARLRATLPPDLNAGETALIYSRGGTLVIEAGGRRSRLDDAELAGKLWHAWLGPASATPGLKRSIARTFALGEDTST